MSALQESTWKPRNIRISENLWRAAQEKAHSEGENISEMIRHMLRTYVGDDALREYAERAADSSKVDAGQ